MATDFAACLRRFLTTHLAGLCGCSPNTVASYRDTFKVLIAYFRDERLIPPGKLTLDRIDPAAITGFLDWLETSRGNSVSTRNQRLAAISSFCTWMQSQDPARMACYQDILAIPAKKQAHPNVNHLTVEQARRLLAQPDRSTRRGRRDATLLATLYDTAARVQELADLTVRDIRLERPAMAALTGKGRKTRYVPLMDNAAAILAAYLAEHRLDSPGHDDHPVFFNQHGPSSAGAASRGSSANTRPEQTTHRSPTSARTPCATARQCTYMRQASRCPTSETSSGTSTCPPPRSTHAPRPRRNAEPSKPPTPT